MTVVCSTRQPFRFSLAKHGIPWSQTYVIGSPKNHSSSEKDEKDADRQRSIRCQSCSGQNSKGNSFLTKICSLLLPGTCFKAGLEDVRSQACHTQTVLPKCPSKSVILRQSYQSQCFAKSVVPRVLHGSFSVGCMRRVPYKSVAPRLSCQESPTKTVLPECYPNPLVECLAKPVSPEYHIRRVIPTMSYKSIFTIVSHKSGFQECLKRVS